MSWPTRSGACWSSLRNRSRPSTCRARSTGHRRLPAETEVRPRSCWVAPDRLTWPRFGPHRREEPVAACATDGQLRSTAGQLSSLGALAWTSTASNGSRSECCQSSASYVVCHRERRTGDNIPAGDGLDRRPCSGDSSCVSQHSSPLASCGGGRRVRTPNSVSTRPADVRQ